MYNNRSRSIFVNLHEIQVPMDQRPQHKIQHTNYNMRVSGEQNENIGIGDNFLNRTVTDQSLRSTINEWNFMKLKSFCKAREAINRKKWQLTKCENIFTNPTSVRALIYKTYQNISKPNNPNKNGQRTKQ